MNLILPNPGQWSHAAGMFFTWDRIFVPRGDGTTRASAWCVVRKRYPTWLGYFHKQPAPPPCVHEPVCIEWVFKTTTDGKEVENRTPMTSAAAAYCSSNSGHYEMDGQPVDVLTHVCKHCGEVYSEIKLFQLGEDKAEE